MTPKEYKKTMTFLERNRNAAEYGFWRWRLNLTWKKVLFWVSPVIAVLVILAIFMLPTKRGTCGENIAYRVEGTTLRIEGTGEMARFFRDPPWWPWSRIITRVEISEGVTEITGTAFYRHTRLRTVSIPRSVTTIGHWAFQDCKRLEEISAPGAVEVGVGAFQDCTSLRRVELCTEGEDGFSGVYDEAFSGCTALESVTMRPHAAFGARCFLNCALLDGLENVTPLWIGDTAFCGCSSLSGLRLEDAEGCYLGEGIFVNCISLTRAALPADAVEVPDDMFHGCTSLTDVTLPEGITAIGEGVFYGCTALETLQLPESLQSIGKDAFADCTGLSTLVIPDGICKIDQTAFRRWTAEQTVLVPTMDLLPQSAAYTEAQVEEKRQ